MSRRPEFLLPGTFLLAILLGTVVLRLPAMHHGAVGWTEAFFTATSAVCVTGLTVVDTGSDFTRAGQVMILILIQLGGLGIMTFGVLALLLFRQRVALEQETAVREIYTVVGRWRVGRLLGAVIGITLLIELVGYIGLRFSGSSHFAALFHSVSAFCNAGFSVNADSMQSAGVGVRLTIMALIIAGGLGFTTLLELARAVSKRPRGRRRFSLNARIVFRSTIVLLGLGTIAIGLLEGDWTNALFMSVTTRTAGFHSVPVGSLHAATLLVMIPLMFVGAAPGSTGGGIKTTTAAVVVVAARRILRGRQTVVIDGRTVPDRLIRRALGVFFFTATVVFGTAFLLILIEGGGHETLMPLLFESVSACATAGLSTGITADLATASKFVLCATMFIGRVGSLSVFLLLVLRDTPVSRLRYPEERVLIG
jgi:trk system potassium uptake protein TrkH